MRQINDAPLRLVMWAPFQPTGYRRQFEAGEGAGAGPSPELRGASVNSAG